LNKDDRDDVVLVTSDTVFSFLAVGDMNLAKAPRTTVLPSREPRDLVFLDGNGDTHTDLCIATSKGTIILLPGDGNGGFAGDAMREVFVWPDIEAVAALPLDDWGDDILVSARSPGLFIVRTLDPKKTVR